MNGDMKWTYWGGNRHVWKDCKVIQTPRALLVSLPVPPERVVGTSISSDPVSMQSFFRGLMEMLCGRSKTMLEMVRLSVPVLYGACVVGLPHISLVKNAEFRVPLQEPGFPKVSGV